jgi:hypothetical protein
VQYHAGVGKVAQIGYVVPQLRISAVHGLVLAAALAALVACRGAVIAPANTGLDARPATVASMPDATAVGPPTDAWPGPPNVLRDTATVRPQHDQTTGVDADDPPPQTYDGKPTDPATLPLAAFVDVTVQFGLDPAKVHGACVAVADFDDNGRADFAVVEASAGKAAIHAVLLGNGPPVHVWSAVDTATLVPAFGCAAFDFDGDAKTDLLLGGPAGAAFYRGKGQGVFTDASTEWLPYINDYVGFSFTPADLDGDGDLDVYVGAGMDPPPCESLKCLWTATDLYCDVVPPIPLTAQLQDRVLMHGDTLPLKDATQAWKVPPGGTQTVAMAFDVDRDGKLDMLVGDDFGSHRLLHNQGGSFATYGTETGFHPYAGAMGWGVSDLDGDGRVEFVLAESGPTPIYEQTKAVEGLPLRVFDRGGEWGVWWPTWGSSAWTPLVADFDHDAQDDLLLGISANFTAEQAADFMNVCSASKEKKNPFEGVPSIDVLFTHGASGGQLEASKLPPGAYPHVVMIDQKLIDLDGDGDLDVVQTRPGPSLQPTSRVRVLRNDLAKQGKSIVVVLRGKGQNQDALGAVVSATIGGKVRKRWLLGGGSFNGLPSRFAHFGLGGANKATGVAVTWPDGSVTAVGDLAAGSNTLVTWK